MFPFTLFYIFYVFHHIFAFELYKGDVYVILDFFFVKAQSSLLAFSMLYDWVLFQGKKNNGNRLVASIDGQLARRLYYIKLVIISMTVFSSLFYDFNTWHTFSEAIYATLVLLILIYFLGGKKLVFKKHSKLWVAQSQLNYQLSTKQREGIHSHFNRLKKVIEKKIATKRNKQVEIKQVQAKHFAVERRNNFQCYPALKIFHRIYDFWLALVIDCKNLRSYGSLL
ncbi:hypothetical protein ACFRAE_03290 [Sphingobacterium sp. HJSM2_6]|uniref:hypothetical protein n=1 Tax=Sphingobacterium sp. HJSM2_6 TaxID=3366264 RepID=UPI003BEA7FBD